MSNSIKYFILLCDGMADRKIEALNGKTPMQAAKKPTMNMLAGRSFNGLVHHVPEGMVPESDTANMSVMSFDPAEYSRGRSPLEAVAMGIDMQPEDTAYRCNIVTLSEDEENYEDKIMIDHSADEISTDEARELIKALDERLGGDGRKFYTGVSYRHCLIWKNAPGLYDFSRPHDIIGKRIGDYLPQGEIGGQFLEYFKKSYDILNHHPVNEARRAKGLRPANSLWLWSPGTKPALPDFFEKWGLHASVISAVDLIKGIAICAGMKPVSVEGATGNIHTNFEGKGQAAIEEFKNGADLVYVHVEAPDECGHRGEVENKVLSIEKIDELILKPVYEYLLTTREQFKIMVLPDHPTPIETRTHSSDPVPFFIYNSARREIGYSPFTEENAAKSGFDLKDGSRLLSFMIRTRQEPLKEAVKETQAETSEEKPENGEEQKETV